MTRHRLTLLFGASCLLVMTGCSQNSGVRDELFRVRDRNKAQMDILKKSNELINRELNDLNEQVVKLTESNDRLSGDLTEFATRPEEIKLEIITEVNTRFGAMAKSQQAFMDQVNQNFETRDTEINEALTTDVAEMEATLVEHAAFVRFVSTEQDSINRVFAMRFDSRPWYQSIIGRYEDMQRAKEAAQVGEAP